MYNCKMEKQTILDALKEFSNQMVAHGKRKLTAGSLQEFFYDKKPQYSGAITRANVEECGKSFGLSYDRITNSFLHEISVSSHEGDAVLRLYHWMLNKGRTWIHGGELADFYKDGNEREKLKAGKIKQYGREVGLYYENNRIKLIQRGSMGRSQIAIAGAASHTPTQTTDLTTTLSSIRSAALPVSVCEVHGNPSFFRIFVDSVEDGRKYVARLKLEANLALDMERNPDNTTSLIQIARKVRNNSRQSIEIYVFDILGCPALVKDVLEDDILKNKDITKIIHDFRSDNEALKKEFDCELISVFDTQVAYSLLCRSDTNGKQGGNRHQIGLNKMLEYFKAGSNSQKENIDHSQWSQRPLSKQQLEYAAQDVAFLLDAFETMTKQETITDTIKMLSHERVTGVSRFEDEYDINMEYLRHLSVGAKYFLSFDPVSTKPLCQERPFVSEYSDEDGIGDSEESCNEQEVLLGVLPESIRLPVLQYHQDVNVQLNELILDLGRLPVLQFSTIANNDLESLDTLTATQKVFTTKICVTLDGAKVSRDDLEHILAHLEELRVVFSSDNRCGIPGTLHRISRKLNRTNNVIAFTMRFGQMVKGSTQIITDIVKQRKSILLIGVPGVGKTTLLRELACVLSLDGVKVEIIDTSNEIAGEGDELHPSIGNARRMMVMDRSLQHDVMIEAVQNHAPECIIIDEIGTKKEATAATDITQRGVQIIGTAHGTELKQVIENPELNKLIGGTHVVILGDDEANRRKLKTKSVLERMGPCAFDCAIELRSRHSWVIYQDLTKAVDQILQKKPLTLEVRRYDPYLKQLTIEKVESYFE